MGTLKTNGDPKSEKGPHGDPGPQMGTHVGAVAKGKARAPHSIKSLSSTDSLVGFDEVGFAKHIHVDQICP